MATATAHFYVSRLVRCSVRYKLHISYLSVTIAQELAGVLTNYFFLQFHLLIHTNRLVVLLIHITILKKRGNFRATTAFPCQLHRLSWCIILRDKEDFVSNRNCWHIWVKSQAYIIKVRAIAYCRKKTDPALPTTQFDYHAKKMEWHEHLGCVHRFSRCCSTRNTRW